MPNPGKLELEGASRAVVPSTPGSSGSNLAPTPG